jgi:hypothetical protein
MPLRHAINVYQLKNRCGRGEYLSVPVSQWKLTYQLLYSLLFGLQKTHRQRYHLFAKT